MFKMYTVCVTKEKSGYYKDDILYFTVARTLGGSMYSPRANLKVAVL